MMFPSQEAFQGQLDLIGDSSQVKVAFSNNLCNNQFLIFIFPTKYFLIKNCDACMQNSRFRSSYFLSVVWDRINERMKRMDLGSLVDWDAHIHIG